MIKMDENMNTSGQKNFECDPFLSFWNQGKIAEKLFSFVLNECMTQQCEMHSWGAYVELYRHLIKPGYKSAAVALMKAQTLTSKEKLLVEISVNNWDWRVAERQECQHKNMNFSITKGNRKLFSVIVIFWELKHTSELQITVCMHPWKAATFPFVENVCQSYTERPRREIEAENKGKESIASFILIVVSTGQCLTGKGILRLLICPWALFWSLKPK